MITESQKNLIKADFFEWIKGIQEDDPLPYEIQNIYFILDLKNNDLQLSYSADDRALKVFDYGAYFPLEAQYFYSNTMKKLLLNSSENHLNLIKKELLEFLKNICLNSKAHFPFFQDKHIFFGLRFKQIKQTS